MRNYKAVSVWDIAPTATESDIQRYFTARLPGCKPIVRPLVQDPKTGLQTTVVTFKTRDSSAAINVLKEHGTEEGLRDSTGTISTPGFSGSFYDLTLLANTVEEPSFE
jgi:hypothetical protein